MNMQIAKRSMFQRLAIVVAVIVQIGATFLPQLGLGDPIGDRSDSVRTLITPAGWAFAIWGVLFLGSGIFAIWQALPSQQSNALVDRIGWYAVVALAMQGIWAIYTQFFNLTVISAIIILISLVCLLAILRELAAWRYSFSSAERWITATTFSALAAWLSAAAIVNISATLTYYGVGGGLSHPYVTAFVILVGGIIAAFAVWRSRGNPWYAAVFCWALLGIAMKGGTAYLVIMVACVVAATMVIYAMLARLSDRKDRHHWLGGATP